MSVGIRGTGCVTGFGLGTEALWSAVLNGESSYQIPPNKFPTTPIELSIAAANEAMAQAGWDSFDGLILATTTGQISEWENPWFEFFQKKIDANILKEPMSRQPLGSLTTALSQHYKFNGPSLLLTSACSASTQALAIAAMWIRQKKVKRCLVGGVEIFSRLTIDGFKSLQLLSETPSTPFSKDRRGINLSEASAFLCLEDTTDAMAFINGYGFSTDAYHITSPHPEGRGLYQAMSMAVRSAGLKPSDISYVHAHATGSPANDSAESSAIHQFFEGQSPVVSATKALHGHALAASGALEAILCVKSLEQGIELKTNGVTEVDPTLRIHVSHENKKTNVKNILKNTLGFGGNNASLVFSKGPR